MNSNREERLQMRQRGAATRKTKAIDFGFSFGLASAPLESTSEPASQSAATATAAEPAGSPQTTSVLGETAKSRVSPARTPSSRNLGSSQRTPGSARNGLPERPSMFDIPSDEELELGRSSKRRKIESPSKVTQTSANLDVTAQDTSLAQPRPDSTTRSAQEGLRDEPQAAAPTTSAEQVSEDVPEPAVPSTSNTLIDDPTEAGENSEVRRAAEEATVTRSGLQLRNGSNSPSLDTINSERSRQESEPHGRFPPEASVMPQDVVAEQAVEEQVVPEQAKADEDTQQPTRAPEVPNEQHIASEMKELQPQRQKRARGRPPASSRTQSAIGEPSDGNRGDVLEKTAPPDDPSKRLRGRSTRSARGTSNAPTENVVPNSSLARGQDAAQPETDGGDSAARAQDVEQSVSEKQNEKKKGRRAGRAGKARQVETEQDKSDESGERIRQEAQPQPGREQEPESEHEPQPELQPDAKPAPEIASRAESPTAQEASSRPKKRRGRPSLASRRDDNTATQPEERQETQQEVEEENSIPTRKRTRQPRGETVPVTVHRLVNVASLAPGASGPDSPVEDGESADELAARGKTKLPKRAGVNPADVLSQICRETLEKTLTTLKNGIANETNPARRAEWTRKKKAVEAYETELEGRLFELSEMLDSNFVLGVQLKKAKREMMDLRGRLYQIRKEREAVALRMDAVRRKHAEEESARMARISINNSLHSLELAVERSQNRASADADDSESADASPTVGLEFMLRSVAEAVSSTAPGAQGGLLDQIKSFNAQLEATARKLES
ncbi:uncharacterized protein NFIA_080860 [Aspergillus fischeri NRRL 181]|uniref:Inner kinetochore subunit AME1 domain-containing protein n=1 Tax=Neosartorya fischeri (strain ATCC 1020 / DSM 3700 / CBS 544.65 / FGSC A1164 / JCM 1740 / NRRL 181 / WB 181) TaxID=331117 RepID=A1DFI5_NEOFI|nr:uncharacterized protein NFIA_080860 [Aspergillus fischeri NRRL 181]EAW18142.1 hypothetical protein NFIA_080860 [Aspergillus fischeri NRRL 181]KAG2025129.1 hypothetical protein GB937_003361 [Aspergillus fischeri]